MIFIARDEELNMNLPLQSLYFYAGWMPFHKKFMTMIAKIQEKYSDMSFFAIDTDQFNNVCKRFSVSSIPTVLIFKNGKEVKRITGLILTSAFKSAFVDIYNGSKGGK